MWLREPKAAPDAMGGSGAAKQKTPEGSEGKCALISHPSFRAPPSKATLANGGSSAEKTPSRAP
jgi:hypothetical protein